MSESRCADSFKVVRDEPMERGPLKLKSEGSTMKPLSRRARACLAVTAVGVLAGCGTQSVDVTDGSDGVAVPLAPAAVSQDDGGTNAKDDDSTAEKAAEPKGVALSELPTAGVVTPWNPGSVKIDTTVYADGMTMVLPCGRSGAWRFDLNRGKSALNTTVGLSDRNAAGTTAGVEILADGKVVTTVDLTVGMSQPVAAPVAGALQLEVRVTTAGLGCSGPIEVAMGDPRVVD